MTGSSTSPTRVSDSNDARPIGIFDSGVGGLSVWREIRRQLPDESTLYLADQAHVPYGPRGREEIRDYCETISQYLLAQDCKAIVVACNTASAAALKDLRERFPGEITIGMEPAVKPAAALTKSGVIGIMATEATFQGRLFLATAGRHTHDRQLINQVCHGLADHIETGDLQGKALDALLGGFLRPILDAGADTVVLACTHYPFALPSIRRLCGEDVKVIDPAPAVARYLGQQLNEHKRKVTTARQTRHRFLTTAKPAHFVETAEKLIGKLPGPVGALQWQDGQLRPAD